MSLPVTEAAREAQLLELFEREYSSWLASQIPEGSTLELAALWKRALHDPIHNFLVRPGKQFRAQLVRTAWLLAGGADDGLPIELPMMIEVLHAGSLIVDDIQDGSQRRRGEPALHQQVGVPIAINTGNLLYCWTLEILARAGLAPDRELALHRRTSRTMLCCHQGQALDLSIRISDLAPQDVPALVRSSTDLKAGTLMELAAEIGGIGAAGAPAAYTEVGSTAFPTRRGQSAVGALARFGRALGLALQMLDDLSGFVNERRREKAREDLRGLRPTWVWSWLSTDLERNAFEGLQRQVRFVSEGADPEGLIDEMGRHLADVGPARVHEHLVAAVAPLDEYFGSGPRAEHLAPLRAEIERLEASYV